MGIAIIERRTPYFNFSRFRHLTSEAREQQQDHNTQPSQTRELPYRLHRALGQTRLSSEEGGHARALFGGQRVLLFGGQRVLRVGGQRVLRGFSPMVRRPT